MVHALHLAYNLLQADGLLINVHDLPIPHVLEVQAAGTVTKAGWLLDRVDFKNERTGFNALAQVVTEGYFLLDDERDFTYNVHVDDLPELQKWLAGSWETAYLPDNTIQRVEEIFHKLGENAGIVLKVPARMTRLKAI